MNNIDNVKDFLKKIEDSPVNKETGRAEVEIDGDLTLSLKKGESLAIRNVDIKAKGNITLKRSK